MKASEIIKEAGDWRTDPVARKAKEREQALGADPASEILTPGVSTAQDIGDISKGDYSAVPYAALGMLPGGGAASKILKKVFRRGDKAADATKKVEPFIPAPKVKEVPSKIVDPAGKPIVKKVPVDEPIKKSGKSSAADAAVDTEKADLEKQLLRAQIRQAEKTTPVLSPKGKLGTAAAATVAGLGYMYGKDGVKAVGDNVSQAAADEFNKPTTTPGVTPPNQVPPKDSVTKPETLVYDPAEEARKETERLFGPDAVKEAAEQKLDPKVLAAIQQGIYGNESGYGKAKTDKPNYAGARGPMQIMPGTFDDMKKKGIIPQDYDIKNPEQNKAAGDALIAHYYKKYEGDPAKVFAAYYAGPGSINKDGTINSHWKDKKNPKAPNVGQYIDQGLSKAGLKVSYASAKPMDTGAAAKPATTTASAPVTIPPIDSDLEQRKEMARLFGTPKPSLTPQDLVKDQAGFASVSPTKISSVDNISDFAKQEASRLAAVAQAKDEFNKQRAAAAELSESKQVQNFEPINTTADLTDLLRLAGRKI